MMRLAASLLLAAGCTSKARLEAERALAGAEHVRVVTAPEQREAIRALEPLGCEDQDVCRVKERCLAVARPTAAGLERFAAARPDVDLWRSDASAPDAAEAARARADAALDQAQREIAEGKAAIPECEAAIAILGRSITGK